MGVCALNSCFRIALDFQVVSDKIFVLSTWINKIICITADRWWYSMSLRGSSDTKLLRGKKLRQSSKIKRNYLVTKNRSKHIRHIDANLIKLIHILMATFISLKIKKRRISWISNIAQLGGIFLKVVLSPEDKFIVRDPSISTRYRHRPNYFVW